MVDAEKYTANTHLVKHVTLYHTCVRIKSENVHLKYEMPVLISDKIDFAAASTTCLEYKYTRL